MKEVITLVKMQLKNQLDFKVGGNKNNLIRKVVFTLLRFIITLAFAYLLFWASSFLQIFHNSPYLPTSLMTMILSLILVISTLSTANNLVKSLILAPDNKLLITLPVETNKIFLSKLIIFYIYELGRNATMTLPLFIAYGMLSPVSPFFYFWVIIAFILISLIPVVFGMVLAIPALYVKRLFVRVRVIKHIFYTLLLASVIYILVQLILIIPPSINIVHYWGPIKNLLTTITNFFQTYFKPVYYLVVMIIGKYSANMVYTYLDPTPWIVFGSLVLILAILLVGTYFVVRFLFLQMISVDLERSLAHKRKHTTKKVKRPLSAFIEKEILISSRTGQFNYNFLLTYIGVPLFLLLVNQIFSSMNLYDDGVAFVQAFNLFLITLTYFASNSVIATFYAQEGRAGYVKKTKPINIISALVAKLIPNMVLSLISLSFSLIVFNSYMQLTFINIFLLTISLFLMQLGSILISALFDLMKPLNELYATSGESVFNPNETKATVFAFVSAIVYALFAFIFLNETKIPPSERYNPSFLKLMLIGVVFLGVAIFLFKWMVKAYYFDERSA